MSLLESRSSLRVLMKHFSVIPDDRHPSYVRYPLREVLLLLICGTLADNDDFDDISAWGEHHLDFLRRYEPFHHGVPCGRWLNSLMNGIDPDLFAACFSDWVAEIWPDTLEPPEPLKTAKTEPAPRHIAMDGKTLRGSLDRAKEQHALHVVSAYASKARLVLAQEAAQTKGHEQETILRLLDRLGGQSDDGLRGAVVTLDAMGCTPAIAARIRDKQGHWLLAVKGNQPDLSENISRLFRDPAGLKIDSHSMEEEGHGRIEHRQVRVCHEIDWLKQELEATRKSGQPPRFADLAAIIEVTSKVRRDGQWQEQTRLYISSKPLSAAHAAELIRAHWQIENGLHWVLDVTFDEDKSRIRTGNGARNMATIRHFAFNMLRNADDNISLKRRRKIASWSPDYLTTLLTPKPVNLDS